MIEDFLFFIFSILQHWTCIASSIISITRPRISKLKPMWPPCKEAGSSEAISPRILETNLFTHKLGLFLKSRPLKITVRIISADQDFTLIKVGLTVHTNAQVRIVNSNSLAYYAILKRSVLPLILTIRWNFDR